ncbi:MAG TPA: hypothetical protein VIH16_04015 [Bellilinea sp.]
MEKKFVIAGVFLVLIIVSGLWLSRTARPLNVLALTVHKLIAVGGVASLVIALYRQHQAMPLTSMQLAMSVTTLVLFLALIATGGLLSTAKTWPVLVLKIHQVIPTLVIFSTAVNLYLLLGRKG